MSILLFRRAVFLFLLMIAVFWFYQGFDFQLGPDPGKVLLDRFGQGALSLLLITLFLTPLQKITKQKLYFSSSLLYLIQAIT